MGVDADVGKMDRGYLAATQRSGVTKQEDGAVANADAGRGVDARHDLGEFGDS